MRAVHVNFIDKNDGTVGHEDEFLFSPYSAFTVRGLPHTLAASLSFRPHVHTTTHSQVRAVHWEAAPLVNEFIVRPHRIELDVAPDNSCEPLDLLLAPWC